MIYQNSQTENTQDQISYAIRELGLGKMLRKANITKNCGVPAYEVFQFLLLLVFQGKNLFRFLHSKHRDQAVSKNTYYRFLNESSYNWGRFLMLLAVKVTSAFDTLTRPERVKVLILDDTVVKRNRSKSVELLARVYDHVEHKFQKGFTLLTLGWSDGYSFIPAGFNMLSSASKSNRYNEASDTIDRRTNGYKFRKESMMHKTDAAIQLISNALAAGIKADYVLMDTWFTTEPMLREILKTGIGAIGMVKQLKQRYTYRGRQYTLPDLKKFVDFSRFPIYAVFLRAPESNRPAAGRFPEPVPPFWPPPSPASKPRCLMGAPAPGPLRPVPPPPGPPPGTARGLLWRPSSRHCPPRGH